MSTVDTTRRALLAGTAAAISGAELLPYVRPAQALPETDGDHPDAELIALGAQLSTARGRRDELNRQADEAADRYEMPDIPEALCWRRSDFSGVWIDRNRSLALYGEGADARWVYADQEEIDSLRENLAIMRAAEVAGETWRTSPQDIARVEEILAASEAWNAEIKAAEDRAGITALQQASARADDLVDRLQRRLVATRARTAAGFAAKARAASANWCTDPSRLVHEIFPKMLAEQGGWDALWSVSLIVDGLNFNAASSGATP